MPHSGGIPSDHFDIEMPYRLVLYTGWTLDLGVVPRPGDAQDSAETFHKIIPRNIFM